MTDNNCRYLTESEISEVLRIQLQDTKLDLTAARARIAELDSMLDRSCSAYQDDIESLNTRIAELEDWQRRAVPVVLAKHGECRCPGHETECPLCLIAKQLLSEVRT